MIFVLEEMPWGYKSILSANHPGFSNKKKKFK